ncbi:MAG: translocation/assembly module TamB domain-containing protein [marine benthic group bacterium]|nr:translocation/assembly module TamB domain-containing protein [Gemmatimonadota bacterium]
MAGNTVRSRPRWSRWLRRLAGALALVVLLLLGFAAWLVGTTSGGRLALSMAPGFLPETLEIEAGEFSGRLIGKFAIDGFALRLPTLELEADRVEIDWRGAGIVRKRIHADRVAVENLDVRLVEAEPDSVPLHAEALPDSVPASPSDAIPLDISFDSVLVAGLTLGMKDSLWVTDGQAVVKGTIEDYRLRFSGRAELPDLPPADVSLAGAGTLSGVRLDSLDARVLGGALAVSGDLAWWPEVTWDADVRADSLLPAQLLPDPEQWPGWLSLVASTTGRLSEEGAVELEATVDTVYGQVRGERLDGRFEIDLEGDEPDLSSVSLEWGPASVYASGRAGTSIAMEFDAVVPELGLLIPGASGRIRADGTATGTREVPRVLASFEASGVNFEGVGVESARGDVDLDLAGPLTGTVSARSVSVAGRQVDRATVSLTGQREAHRLSVSASGPGAELDLVAAGGLDPANAWSGSVEQLQFTADTIGSWAVSAPFDLFVSAEEQRLGRVCLESAPTRLCAEAELTAGSSRLEALVDSLHLDRLAPWMPEDVSVEAVVNADLALEIGAAGEVTGQAEIRTSQGVATRDLGGETRRLSFEPIELTVASGPDGLSGAVEMHVADSTGASVLDVLGRAESPVAIRVLDDFSRLSDQPLSAQLTVDSLHLSLLAPWMPEGLAVEAVVDADLAVEIGSAGDVTGEVELHTSEGMLTRDVRGETRRLFFEPIEVTASSGPDGLNGAINLHLADSAGVRVLDVLGQVESPVAVRTLDDLSRLGDQPFSGRLQVEADDLLLLTDDLLPLWDVSGSFSAEVNLDLDADGNLDGNLLAATDSMVLRNTVRGQGWTLVVDPARLVADVGPEGLAAELELVVDGLDQSELLAVSGRIDLPRLTSLRVDPKEQPVDGSLEVRMDDLSVVEAFLIDISEARGGFLLTTQVGGTLAELTVDGEARVSDGYALIPTLGLELTDIQFSAAGRPNGNVEVDGRVRSGEGTLTLTGRSERYPSAETPSVFQVRGERFLLMDIPEVNLLANPSLDLAFDGTSARLTGTITIPRGRLGFPELPPSAVTPSEDVIIVGDTLVEREPPVPFGADITVTLGDDVFFNGFGFASNLVGDVRIQQEPNREPVGRGQVRFINGTFRSFGQELRIEPGRLLFSGPIDEPAVEARAFVRASDGTEAGFQIGGTVQDLDVTTYSVPPKSDSDVMAYILFGRPMNQTSGSEGSQASNYAAVLGANMLAMSLAPSLGLDEARIDTGSSQNKAQFVVGKYLSPRLFVGYGVGIYEPISTLRLRYLLTARWSIEAITGDQQSTDLLWRIEAGGPKPEALEEEAAVSPGDPADVSDTVP